MSVAVLLNERTERTYCDHRAMLRRHRSRVRHDVAAPEKSRCLAEFAGKIEESVQWLGKRSRMNALCALHVADRLLIDQVKHQACPDAAVAHDDCPYGLGMALRGLDSQAGRCRGSPEG
jgi:hypothetical protein